MKINAWEKFKAHAIRTGLMDEPDWFLEYMRAIGISIGLVGDPGLAAERRKEAELQIAHMLNNVPAVREGYEKGHFTIQIDRHGNLEFHTTKAGYLAMMDPNQPDLGDPWGDGRPKKPVKFSGEGYNPELSPNDPYNQKWAEGMVAASEKRFAEMRTYGNRRQPNTTVAIPPGLHQ